MVCWVCTTSTSIYLLLVYSTVVAGLCNNVEECLIKRLFEQSSYDNRARPLPSFNEDVPVQVAVRLDLHRLLEVDVRQQKIFMHFVVYYNWLDSRLAWNPKDFGNITSVVVDQSYVWVPDVFVINAANGADLRLQKNLVRIQTVFDPTTDRWLTSDVSLTVSTVYEPMCSLDMRYFPFDRQTCVMTLGSAVLDGSKLQLRPAADHVTLEQYEDSGEWSVADLKLDADFVFYNCCRLPFSQLQARINLKRKPLFYVVNLILPTLVTNLLATVGLFANLSASGGELTAVTLGLTTLLSFSILLLSVSEQLPRGSQWISLIGVYFVSIIIQTCVATVISVYLMRPKRRQKWKRLFCRKIDDERKPSDDGAPVPSPLKSDECLESWCMCFHVVFTLTFTVALLAIGAVNAYAT